MCFGRLVELEKPLNTLIWVNANFSNRPIFENMTPMCTSGPRPLIPIFWSIQNWECTARWVHVPLRKPCRNTPPPLRFLNFSEWSPPGYPMWYSWFLELGFGHLLIMFLNWDTIESWKYTKCCKEFISGSDLSNNRSSEFLIIIKPHPRTSSVITIICRNEGTREGFQWKKSNKKYLLSIGKKSNLPIWN